MKNFIFITFIILFNFLFLTQNLEGQCTVPVSQNMTMLYNWDTAAESVFSEIWGYADNGGNEYGIIGGYDKIYVVDVTDPGNSFLIDSDDPPGTSSWRDFKTYGHYLYAVSEYPRPSGLRVYDLDSLSSGKLHLVGVYTNNFGSAHNIFIEESTAKLYVVGSNSVNEGVLIFDLSSDSLARNPGLLKKVRLDTLAGDFTLNTYIHDIFVKDDIAYCSHGYGGYGIWDLSDLNNLGPSDFLSLMDNSILTQNSYVHNSWNSEDGRYAYVSTEVNNSNPLKRQIYIVDQLDLTDPLLKSTWRDPLLKCQGYELNLPHNAFILGNKMYLSSYEDGVQIMDVSNPINPIKIAYYDTYPSNTTYNSYQGCWGVYPYLPSGRILASDRSNGLFLLELDDCASQLTYNNQTINELSILVATDQVTLDNVNISSSNPITVFSPKLKVEDLLTINPNANISLYNLDVCD